MALPYSALEAITEDYYQKNRVEDIYFKASIMLYRLLGNGGNAINLVSGSDTVDGGKRLVEFLEHDEANSSTYGNSTSLSATRKEIFNQASFAWSGYNASNTINLDDQVQNGDSPRAMVKMIQGRLNNISKTIRNTMNEGIFGTRAASTDTYGFDGLGDLFNTTTTTAYGNIQEGDMAEWSANVITTAEAISYSVLQDIMATASVGQTEEDHPNLILTTRTLMDAYNAKLQIQQRFVKDKDMVQAGFKHTLHDGVVLGYDAEIAAGTLYALNLRHLFLKTHKDYNFTQPKWVAFSEAQPDLLTANCRWVGALTTRHRAAHCKHSGLTAN